MIHVADWLGHWFVDVYLLGSVLLVLALIATAALRQPVHRLTLTKSLFIALALLAALCAVPSWSVLHLITAKPTAPSELAQPVSPLISSATITREMLVPNPPLTTPILAAPPAHTQIPSRMNISVWALAGAIESIGTLGVLIWLTAGWAAAHSLRRQAHKAPSHIQQLLQEIAQTSPSKNAAPTKILLSNRINVPVALGLRHPTIVLPHTMADSPSALHTPPSELAPILAHELAHIQNNDLHWLALSRLLLIIFWPQPLYWFARRRMRLDQESLADAAAADLTTREKYAEQLVAWARNLTNTYPARLASAVGLWEGASQLRQRVALLLDDRITILRDFSRKWQLSTIGLCTILAASLSLITLRPAQSQSREKTTSTNNSSPVPAPGLAFEKRSVAPNSIAVRVADEHGQPIENQRVDLFRLDLVRGKPAMAMMSTLTNNDGAATFSDIIHPDNAPFVRDYPDGKIEARPGLYGQLAVLVKSPGHASWLTPLDEVGVFQRGGKIVIRLTKSASLKGRITNTQGEPVAGAIVSTVAVDIPGFRTATTNNDGRYELADEAAVDLGGESTTIKDTNTFAASKDHVSVLQLNLIVRHPDYAEKLVPCTRIPSTVDARLERGGTIEGRVVLADQDTIPINIGTRVCAEEAPTSEPRRKTDPTRPAYSGIAADGHFRIGPLRPGRYSLFCEKTGWFNSGVNAGLRDIDVKAGKATKVADLTLSVGSTVRVQLIDASSHQPISLENETRGIAIIVPKPGTNGRTIDRPINVDQDGRFDIRMPVGTCGLSISVGDWRVNANEHAMFDVPKMGSIDIKVEISKKESDAKAQSHTDASALRNSQHEAAPSSTPKNDSALRPRPAPATAFNSAPLQRSTPNQLAGRVVDAKQQPLADVEISVFSLRQSDSSRKLITQLKTDSNGEYRADNLIDPAKEFPDGKFPQFHELRDDYLQVVGKAPGFASQFQVTTISDVVQNGNFMPMVMQHAVTVRGKVSDSNGKPVVGASVSIGTGPEFYNWAGANSAKTDAAGSYVIEDANPFDLAASENGPKDPLLDQIGAIPVPPALTITHPSFATKQVVLLKAPGTQDITLEAPATLGGRVIFGESGKPASDVLVQARSMGGTPPVTSGSRLPPIVQTAAARTGADGTYKIETLPGGQYELWAEADNWTNLGAVINPESGKPNRMPDLTLTKGGVISARLVDEDTGKPIPVKRDTTAMIVASPMPFGLSGPTVMRPAISATAEGRFELHSAPGKKAVNVAGVSDSPTHNWIGRKLIEVDVVEGQTVQVDLPAKELTGSAWERMDSPYAPENQPPTGPFKSVSPVPAPAPPGAVPVTNPALHLPVVPWSIASKSATLTGHVTGLDDKPISGATVSITPDNAPPTAESANTPFTKTDSAGNFKLEGLKPFNLAAYYDRIDELKKRSVDGNILYIPPAILTVEATGCATKQIAPQSIPGQQDVQLERPAILEGRVLFEGDDQRGAGNVLVVAVATFTDETSRLYSSGRYLPLRADVHTDQDGKYRFTTLPPGSYSVFATTPDWATDRVQSTDSNTKTPVQLPDIILTKRGIDDSRSEENKQKLTTPLLATMAKDNGYELKADQDVRRVAPPFAPIRLQYYGVENPLQADVLPAGPDAMTFLWNDGKLQGHGMFFNGLNGYDLPSLLDAIFSLPDQQIEAPADLLHNYLPGDWVVRKDADENALTAQLQHILQTELAQPIKLRIATVERSVYVAHGNFTGSPVPVSWAKRYEPRPRANSGSVAFLPGEGPYRLNLFLNWVGEWIQTPIVSEVPDAPMNVAWRLDELRDNIKHEDVHDAERVLADLTTQTGIEFALEKCAIKTMFVERATP